MNFFSSDQFSRGGHTWLASRAGTDVPRTGTLKISELPEEFQKVVPSGLPVKQGTGGNEDYLVPAGSTDTPLGFVLGYFPAEGSMDGEGIPVGYIWQGAINTQNLPVENFQVPEDTGLFSYVGGNKGDADGDAGEEG